MTGELAGAAAGAVLATGVATYVGVRLHRRMPIVTWRAWVAGFPVRPLAWTLAAAATLTLAATAVVAVITISRQDHPDAAANGDPPSPAAVPVTSSPLPGSRQTRSASSASPSDPSDPAGSDGLADDADLVWRDPGRRELVTGTAAGLGGSPLAAASG